MPCPDCQSIIDAPTGASNAEPHAALSEGSTNVLTFGKVTTYECRVCHTKFKRADRRPARGVEWTLLS